MPTPPNAPPAAPPTNPPASQRQFPGVYIVDTSAFNRTISGVPTTVTAIVGRTPRGSTAVPTPLFSFAEYERWHGGLETGFPVGECVRDFFANGGAQMVVVRLAAADATAATASVGGLSLVAANPGSWGNQLRASVDRAGVAGDGFNLRITLGPVNRPTLDEHFTHLSARADGGVRRIDRVLAEQSHLARVATNPREVPLLLATPPAAPPAALPVPTSATAFAHGADGAPLTAADYLGDAAVRTGLWQLDAAGAINLLCVPPDHVDGDTDPAVYQAAADYCRTRRAFLIVDPPRSWTDAVRSGDVAGLTPARLVSGESARFAAVYVPRVLEDDVSAPGTPQARASSGAVAGVMARTTDARGVWKAPAGLEAGLVGVRGLEVVLSDAQNGVLNVNGVNALRVFPAAGPVVWGARTMRGQDALADDYRYVPVRRLANFIELSVLRGTQWSVFEPNAEPLWADLRQDIGAFLTSLERQGAIYGHAVRCDATTTTPADVANGVVQVLVLFAPLKPAEFLVLRIELRVSPLAD